MHALAGQCNPLRPGVAAALLNFCWSATQPASRSKTAGNCCPADDESHRVPIRAGEAQRRRSSARLSGGDYGSALTPECHRTVSILSFQQFAISTAPPDCLLSISPTAHPVFLEVGLLLNVNIEETGSEQARDRSSQHFSTSTRGSLSYGDEKT
jgi:hypothetical protein